MRPSAIVDFAEAGGARTRLEFGQPRAVLRADTLSQVPEVLRAAQQQADAGAWVVGMVAYEAAPAFDPALQVKPRGALPLAWFAVHDRPRLLGGASEEASEAFEATLAADPGLTPRAPPEAASGEPAGAAADTAPEFRAEPERARFEEQVARIRRAIGRGECYQVNHTLRLQAPFEGCALALYRRLRAAQPAGYCAYLDLGRHRIVSASPELFFRRDGTLLTTRPMKGTRPRGRHPREDESLRRELLESAKDRAENLMIVDLLRNDLSRIAQPHGVEVPERFAVERHPTVWQMRSTVTARMRPGLGLAEIFGALFPCGSVTGAPKVRAMAWIAEHEADARGAYCGALGMLRPGGDAVFNVAIRTVTVDSRAGRASCGLGCGIVWDSTPADEYAELLVKSRFLQRDTRPFELLETLRVEQGVALREALHLARLEASARYFGFPVRPQAWRECLRSAAAGAPGARARLRLLLDARGRLRASLAPLPEGLDGKPALFALAGFAVSRDEVWLFHKTTRRQVYERAAAEHPGLFDVLLRNEQGELTEFTRGNLALELDGRLLTPALDCGLLDGCLRREWLEQGRLHEAVLTVEHLRAAKRVWFLNSLRGALELRWQDAKP
ncbi:MAG: aminodeoxychorismate synthase component I [Betaproteobacteria bacterium]|nr:aminodeoxychorismate synthase component I [Betaproteobacteria bacterium]